MDLAYRCQMLPAATLKSRSLTVVALLRTGWPQNVIDSNVDAAISWARSQQLTARQEKSRKARAAKKTNLRGNEAVEAMFASVGVAPGDILSGRGDD